jgi:phage head maturation protease
MEAWAHHDQTKPIGSQAAGNLRLTDSPVGVLYQLELPEGNTDADNVVSLARSDKGKPIIGGTSFGFRIAGPDGQQWKRENGENIREVMKADVNHISPVVTPAYPQTSAMLRSLTAHVRSHDADMVDEYGIDLNLIAKIFIAAKRGLQIADNEIEVARAAIKLLEGRIQTPRLERAMDQVSRLLM